MCVEGRGGGAVEGADSICVWAEGNGWKLDGWEPVRWNPRCLCACLQPEHSGPQTLLLPLSQVAALRQQIARLQSENATLKKSAAAATPPLPGSGGKTAAAAAADAGRWQLLEQMQGDMSGLEMENARLKVQMVRGPGGKVWHKVWKVWERLQGDMNRLEGERTAQGPHDAGWRQV